MMSPFWPLWLLAGGGFASLVTSVWGGQRSFRVTGLLALAVLLAAGYGFGVSGATTTLGPDAILRLDGLGAFLACLVCGVGAITVLFSYGYWEKLAEPIREVLPLLLFAVLGMVLMVLTTHLITLVLALELMSLCLYVLVGVRRQDPKSSEGAIKYFLLGSVAAAFLLFGVSFLYGATGQLDLVPMAKSMVTPDRALMFQGGALLVLLGLAFKVAAVPFHFWAPDVYDGAPTPVTGFMAAGVKVAAFGVLLRLLQVLVGWQVLELGTLLSVLAVATMLVGNLTALRQRSVKRIMAYSSVAHAGYLLLGLATLSQGAQLDSGGVGVILFYLGVYALLTLGVFALLTWFSAQGKEIGELGDLKGLAYRHPWAAAALSLFLISLAGIPPTAGFVAKYFLFARAIDTGLLLPAILGILTSAVSLYYYLGPVVQMYFHEGPEETAAMPAGLGAKALVILLALGTLYLGIFPGRFLSWSQEVANSWGQSPPVVTQELPLVR